MILFAGKIVDDILLAVTDVPLWKFINGFGSALKLGEMINGAGVLKILGCYYY